MFQSLDHRGDDRNFHPLPDALIAALKEAHELLAHPSIQSRERHDLRNELNALEMMAEMHRRFGNAYSEESVNSCLARMRITVVTGRYPIELLVPHRGSADDGGKTTEVS